MKQTKPGIVQHLTKALGTQGLRIKLFVTGDGAYDPFLVEKINTITNRFDAESEGARILACRCIAAGLNSRGELSNHSNDVWDLGQSLRETNSDLMLQKLTRIVSLPFNQAQEHIYNLIRYLVSKNVPVNYNRLYWDLINLQLGEKDIAHNWITSYARL